MQRAKARDNFQKKQGAEPVAQVFRADPFVSERTATPSAPAGPSTSTGQLTRQQPNTPACVVIVEDDPKPGARIGRMSFRNFNPEVQALTSDGVFSNARQRGEEQQNEGNIVRKRRIGALKQMNEDGEIVEELSGRRGRGRGRGGGRGRGREGGRGRGREGGGRGGGKKSAEFEQDRQGGSENARSLHAEVDAPPSAPGYLRSIGGIRAVQQRRATSMDMENAGDEGIENR
ncbi:hypothetical protein CBR_g8764 [Chara braunii]|uniref:Uncharacterized protein n=1 Tax=Chara braunii TaxID=69332 RepID=A0A388KMQ6_CHABU|nr:hypothetical protein CBR_g8764 [Chara braunii]|eukprot:GBG71344.1 hypothetical protein CBR_g8764 [Chara braunii]